DGGHNLFLVAIIKWLRLKHELGLNLLPADYLLVKKALTLAETSSQNNESSPLIKQAIQELIDQAIDPEAAVKELDNLGVTDRADFHPKVIQSEVAASPKEGNNNGEPNKVGGIDLDAKKLDLRIKRDGSGVPLPVDQQDWSKINIQGFTPVIYKIAPVNIITLLGLNKVGQASPDSHSEKAAIVLPEGKELGS
ncbi:MAG: hypothetical protein HGA80_04775, partial [Candidatus Omnitrophica bacterium]|nr:hypothetical protein [Candidatus Omnitrophota bacterium]